MTNFRNFWTQFKKDPANLFKDSFNYARLKSRETLNKPQFRKFEERLNEMAKNQRISNFFGKFEKELKKHSSKFSNSYFNHPKMSLFLDKIRPNSLLFIYGTIALLVLIKVFSKKADPPQNKGHSATEEIINALRQENQYLRESNMKLDAILEAEVIKPHKDL